MRPSFSALVAMVVSLGVSACSDGASSTGSASSTSTASATSKPKPSASSSAKPNQPTEKPTSASAPNPPSSASPTASSDGGTSTTGYDSPEAFGKAMAEAFTDPAKLGSLFPADSVIDANFECTPPDAFRNVVRGAIAEISKDLKKRPGPYEFVKAEEKGEVTKLAARDKVDDCTMKADAETMKFRVTLKSSKEEDSGGVEIIKLGGKYYAIGM